VIVDGRDVPLTNLDRVLFPRAGFTKGDLVDYYVQVAPALLPHVRDRALTLGRWPGGVDARGFAQTECRGRPEWMATSAVRLRDGRVREHCVVDSAAALAWVANQSAIELHPFLARAGHHDEPTHVVLDLDPGPATTMADCCRVALALRELLGELGLAAVVKTSGSLGLHLHVPLGLPHDGEHVKRFARAVAEALAQRLARRAGLLRLGVLHREGVQPLQVRRRGQRRGALVAEARPAQE
jgi:bifunctional non-homologous end joining protein LigD